MTLQNGTRLGPYEIVAPLGAGGMGEVYRARDTRLGRSVAIKILPDGFAADSRMRLRLEREAKAISALNHPHICTLHDVGRDSGIDYLVLEHCEGKTLARRIADGPLPVAEVTGYALQIADALDKAHRRGIIHRDLKPSNIMITKVGVKILDFGLARESDDLSVDDSTRAQLSDEGTVVGTVPYMAPEVLNGQVADARSDLFAFGLIVYEMLTGERAFGASGRAALIASILERQPKPLRDVRPDTPAGLEKLVNACLVKDPDDRLQAARDVVLQLQWIAEAAAEPQSRRRSIWPAAAATIGLLALAAAITISVRRTTEPPPAGVRRLAITLPAEMPIADVGGNLLAISPDGRSVVYVGPKQVLHVRHIERLGVVALAGTEGASSPFFSPDGNWIGFEADQQLRKVALSGGQPVTILGGVTTRGAVWGADDVITYAEARATLMRVPASGGTPQPLPSSTDARWPASLPGTDALLVTRYDQSGDEDRHSVAIFTPRDGKFRTIFESAMHAQYSPSGYVIFLRAGSAYRVGFDAKALKVTDRPEPILNDVQSYSPQAVGRAAVSGKAIYYLATDPALLQRQLVWVNRRGEFVPVVDQMQGYGMTSSPQLSPDGKQLLTDICVGGVECDIWRYEIERATWNRITSDGRSYSACWSPDGRSIAYASNRKGPYNIFIVPIDGSGQPKQLTSGSSWTFPQSWSPDGKTLAIFDGSSPMTGGDIWLQPLDGRERAPYLTTNASESEAEFSPDGQWLAYTSTQSGSFEVYIRHANGKGATVRVSADGGAMPRWRGDGKELFYRRGKVMMAASVRLAEEVSVGKPAMLFEGNFGTSFDVTRDGQRFLMTRLSDLAPRTQINVVEGLLE